ncbi:MAG: squalene/phytoene synthase family protein [Bacteroidales bacterium]|nr:squalene/phytoene synthase family protein [Bacteroidales bacterium]MCF8404020.1 squalene/phytoene synthase family protein [Bacteroidales bacterium]
MQATKLKIREILEEIQFDKLNKHPNILISAGFWEPDRYHAASICYQFMRKIDDMIDNRKADMKTIDDCEKSLFTNKVYDWVDCLQGIASNDSSLSEIIKIINAYHIPLDLFHNFAKSMIYDIHNDGFPSFTSFLEYTEGAAVAPASVFLHLCCLSETHTEYVTPVKDIKELARPCAIFSYIVHIIRDFQTDQLNNLNYFAEDILRENNLQPADLKIMAQSGKIHPNFRKVVTTYLDYAREYKQKTEIVIQQLEPQLDQRYLLSLKIIFGLYLEIYKRIDTEKGSFQTADLTPTPAETKKIVKETILSSIEKEP